MTTTSTWSLVQDAARVLGGDGADFRRSDLVDAVIRRDPTRRADSIGPIIQRMTGNATGGVPSPFRLCGGYFAIGTWVVAEVLMLLTIRDSSLGGGTGTNVPAWAGSVAVLMAVWVPCGLWGPLDRCWPRLFPVGDCGALHKGGGT